MVGLQRSNLNSLPGAEMSGRGYLFCFTGIALYYTVPESRITAGARIFEALSVYPGEMLEILLGLQWVEEVRLLRAVTCSDTSLSLNSLKSSCSHSWPDVQQRYNKRCKEFRWWGWAQHVFGYQNIRAEGNEPEDEATEKNYDTIYRMRFGHTGLNRTVRIMKKHTNCMNSVRC